MAKKFYSLDPEDDLEGCKLNFYKDDPNNKTIWVRIVNRERTLAFTFDKKLIYFLYRDYDKLPPEEKEIFDRENPYWKECFNP